MYFKLFFDLDDEQRSGRPQEMVSDDLQALLDQDPSQSTSELATQLNVDQSTISRRLNEMGKVHKAGKWVPYKFSENNKCQRLTTCVSLLARNKKKDYLWKIVTGDEKWKMKKWKVLAHPAYSPDLAPSDYHLFRSMEHFLRGKEFENNEDLKNHLDQYFDSKPQSFYREGIRELPLRWQSSIDNNGDYFDDL